MHVFLDSIEQVLLCVTDCYAGLSHLAALQQFEALLAIPGIVPKMVTVSLLLHY